MCHGVRWTGLFWWSRAVGAFLILSKLQHRKALENCGFSIIVSMGGVSGESSSETAEDCAVSGCGETPGTNERSRAPY